MEKRTDPETNTTLIPGIECNFAHSQEEQKWWVGCCYVKCGMFGELILGEDSFSSEGGSEFGYVYIYI